jgi:hypothetical protein
MIARALERFNEYIQARFLEWHIGLLKRRMEKMKIEKEARHLKAAEARSTCKECEETAMSKVNPDLMQVRRFKIPLCAQFKNFMDEQAKINEDTVTKFEAMEKNIEEFRWQGEGGRKLYT